MKKITPFLWFNTQAEEAAKFYASVFKNSKMGNVVRYGKGAPGPEGSVVTVEFSINGEDFIALNGGPQYSFTPAVSFVVNCKDQDEVDYYWEKLSDGGQIEQCGWLRDKYGLSWQIVPETVIKMLKDKDPEKSRRVMEAVWKMVKLDVKTLEEAYNQ